MIAPSKWIWYGHAGHFMCGRWCRFHMCTEIGKQFISTVGLYVHPRHGCGREDTEMDYLRDHPNGEMIGINRFYETMVFAVTGKRCADKTCNCGMPEIDGCELEADGYLTAGEARKGHMTMCLKYAKKQVTRRRKR